MPALEEILRAEVITAVNEALAPYTARLVDPEPLTWTIPQAAVVIGTSPTTVRKLVDAGHLPLVPHMGERRLIPRAAVEAFVHQTDLVDLPSTRSLAVAR